MAMLAVALDALAVVAIAQVVVVVILVVVEALVAQPMVVVVGAVVPAAEAVPAQVSSGWVNKLLALAHGGPEEPVDVAVSSGRLVVAVVVAPAASDQLGGHESRHPDGASFGQLVGRPRDGPAATCCARPVVPLPCPLEDRLELVVWERASVQVDVVDDGRPLLGLDHSAGARFRALVGSHGVLDHAHAVPETGGHLAQAQEEQQAERKLVAPGSHWGGRFDLLADRRDCCQRHLLDLESYDRPLGAPDRAV